MTTTVKVEMTADELRAVVLALRYWSWMEMGNPDVRREVEMEVGETMSNAETEALATRLEQRSRTSD